MTEEELIKDGWKKDVFIEFLYQYNKTINGFHYIITCNKKEKCYNNWYKYNLHIDTPDFRTVASLEIDDLEHVYKISEIYKV